MLKALFLDMDETLCDTHGANQQAQQLINIGQHQGEHPRIGAVDVVPWIPIEGVNMEDCVRYANELGARIGQELEIPVFLYEEAGKVPSRVKLEIVRRGGLAALGRRMKIEHEWRPDYGPPMIHSTAGAIAVGARFFLIAFNIVLKSDDLAVANNIAKTIRSSSGGLLALKAMGVSLVSRELVQVSMNLTDYRETSLRQAYTAVSREAQRYEIEVLESEIVGLIPRAAWDEQLSHDLKLQSMEPDLLIESRLEQSSMF